MSKEWNSDVLQRFYSLSVSEWSVNSEKNMLIEAIRGTINLEVNVSFSNDETWIHVNHEEVTHLCQKITQGECCGGYSGL